MEIKVESKYTLELSSSEFYTLVEALKQAKLDYNPNCIAYDDVNKMLKQLEELK